MASVLWKNVVGSVVGLVWAYILHEVGMLSGVGAIVFGVLCAVVLLASTPATWIRAPKLTGSLLPPDTEATLVALDMRLDEYKIFGTHNSTHVCNVFGALTVPAWQYTHPPIATQLEAGLRALEIDIWYNRRAARWEVRHENLIDSLTVGDAAHNFDDTMRGIREWSARHPHHFPLTINLDIKGAFTPGLGWAAPLIGRGMHAACLQTRAAYDCLKAELLQVWGGLDGIVTPGSLSAQEGMPLRHHVKQHGWPGVSQMSGKTLFFLNLYGDRKDSYPAADDSFFFVRGHCHQRHLHAVYFEHLHTSSADEEGYLLRMLARKATCLTTTTSKAHMVAVDDISVLDVSVVPLPQRPARTARLGIASSPRLRPNDDATRV